MPRLSESPERQRRCTARTLAAALILLASARLMHAPPPDRRCAHPADLVLRGGRVFTADSLRPWAQALAVRGGRIVAVGNDRVVSGCIGRGTRVVALDGRVVIAGINDAHDHVGDVLPGTPLITEPSPTPDPPSALVRDSLRAAATRARPGTWIMGQIGLRALSDTTFRRDALDAAAPQHPVALFTWWGHPALINSSAMRQLGITESVRDPLGGWYERDARGRLTGRVDETVKMDIDRRIRATMPMDSLVRALRAYSADALTMGVTRVQVMATALPPALEVESFRQAALADGDRAGVVYAYGADGLRHPWVHLLNAISGAPQRVTTREGMLADLAVRSQDVLWVPPEALPATRASDVLPLRHAQQIGIVRVQRVDMPPVERAIDDDILVCIATVFQHQPMLVGVRSVGTQLGLQLLLDPGVVA